MSRVGDRLVVGVTYWPADAGPYLWSAFDAERIARDFTAIADAGFGCARLPLAWDLFLPSHRRVSPRRLRQLEVVVQRARAVGLRLVLGLFVQSVGDCVMLPRYLVDRHRPRPGVRVVCDQVVESGGPRDVYVDPLVLEVEERWLTTLLDAFANHPAIAAWELGWDPATTVRPRRIAHLASWAAHFGEVVRRRGDRSRLTLGWRDLVLARGVRLSAVAPHVDELGLAVDVDRLAAAVRGEARAATLFGLDLAARLSAPSTRGPTTPLTVAVALASGEEDRPPRPAPAGEAEPHWDLPLRDGAAAAQLTEQLLPRLAAAGAAALEAAAWSDLVDIAFVAPPFDRLPSLARLGLVDTGGTPKAVHSVWSLLATEERAVVPLAPWPETIDVAGYYANLPDSVLDLFSRWLRERDPAPPPAAE